MSPFSILGVCDLMPSISEPPFGPDWDRNSCALDCVLWLARVMGVGRFSCDVENVAVRELDRDDGARTDAIQHAVLSLLASDWDKRGIDSINNSRNEILLMWRTLRFERDTGNIYHSANLFYDKIFHGLPSLTWTSESYRACESTKPGVRCPAVKLGSTNVMCEVEGWTTAHNEKLLKDRRKKEEVSLDDILSTSFLDREKLRNCDVCGSPERKYRLLDRLPPLLTIVQPPQPALRIVKNPMILFTYTDRDFEEVRATYRVKGMILYKDEFFKAFALRYEGYHVQNAYWYDSLDKEEGNVRCFWHDEFEEWLSGNVGRVELLWLEQVLRE